MREAQPEETSGVRPGAAPAEVLSAQDESFLVFEEPGHPMHVGAVALMRPGSLRSDAGPLDLARIRAEIAARLPNLPRLTRRLSTRCGRGERARWIDAEDFSIERHVVVRRLDDPRRGESIGPAIGAVLAEPLSRDRPLWCITLLDGAEPDTPFLMILRAHHALVDGVAAVQLLTRLLEPEPGSSRSSKPGGTEGLREPDRGGRDGGSSAGGRTARLAASGRAMLGLWRSTRRGLGRTSATALNGPPLEARRHATLSFELDRLRASARALGVSRNDLFVAAVAGAARSWLDERGVAGRATKLRAMVPVALRHRVEASDPGNDISALVVDLPVEHDSPPARARAASLRIRRQFARGEALGPLALAWLAERLGRWVLSFGRWLTARRRSYNLVVSSIPGPRHRLRLHDAELCTLSPVIPLFRGQRFSIGGIGYAGRFFVGILSAGDDQAGLDAFARGIQRELSALIEEGDGLVEEEKRDAAPLVRRGARRGRGRVDGRPLRGEAEKAEKAQESGRGRSGSPARVPARPAD